MSDKESLLFGRKQADRRSHELLKTVKLWHYALQMVIGAESDRCRNRRIENDIIVSAIIDQDCGNIKNKAKK